MWPAGQTTVGLTIYLYYGFEVLLLWVVLSPETVLCTLSLLSLFSLFSLFSPTPFPSVVLVFIASL